MFILKESVLKLQFQLENLKTSTNTNVEVLSDDDSDSALELNNENNKAESFISENIELSSKCRREISNTNLEKEDILQETEKETIKIQETSENNQNVDVKLENLIRENSWFY